MSMLAGGLAAGLLLTIIMGAEMCYRFGDAEGYGPLAPPDADE